MKIIKDLPRMAGTFLAPEGRLPEEWACLKSERDVVLILEEPSSCALAFKVWPNCKQNIKLIVYAGGTLDRGDGSAFAEASILADPFGMESLLNSGVPVLFATLEKARELNMSCRQLALDYAKYETYECGGHVEINSGLAFGKLVCDHLADKKFNKRNMLLFR